jgi:hypothetical protein
VNATSLLISLVHAVYFTFDFVLQNTFKTELLFPTKFPPKLLTLIPHQLLALFGPCNLYVACCKQFNVYSRELQVRHQSSPDATTYRREIHNVYKEKNKEKLSDLPGLLAKNSGKELELLARVKDKYFSGALVDEDGEVVKKDLE